MINELHTPWLIATIFAYYVWYAPVSWIAIAWRCLARRISRKEVILLLILAFLIGTEIFLLSIEYSFSKHESWGLVRYFSAFGPLLWIWLAWGIVTVCSVRRQIVRRVALSVCVGLGLYLGGSESVRYLYTQSKLGDAADAFVAARRIAPVIQKDYLGPRRFSKIKYKTAEYYTSRRPVVFSNYGMAAWCVRGQSEGANLGVYPMKPDYLFLNMSHSGYRGAKALNPDEFEGVTETKGLTSRWVLLRRKGLLHR